MNISFDARVRERSEKALCFALRHSPSTANIKLDDLGWVNIEDLLRGISKNHPAITKEYFFNLIKDNDLFMVSENGLKIRATAGHSVKLKMELVPAIPPESMYFVSTRKSLQSILQEGIRSIKRVGLHLTNSRAQVLDRIDRNAGLVAYQIDTKKMSEDGVIFYKDEFDVWLCKDTILPMYITEYLVS